MPIEARLLFAGNEVELPSILAGESGRITDYNLLEPHVVVVTNGENDDGGNVRRYPVDGGKLLMDGKVSVISLENPVLEAELSSNETYKRHIATEFGPATLALRHFTE